MKVKIYIWSIIIIIFLSLITIGCYDIYQQEQQRQQESNDYSNWYYLYKKLHDGMTQDEVENILGVSCDKKSTDDEGFLECRYFNPKIDNGKNTLNNNCILVDYKDGISYREMCF